jgi:hypothetical protein
VKALGDAEELGRTVAVEFTFQTARSVSRFLAPSPISFAAAIAAGPAVGDNRAIGSGPICTSCRLMLKLC